MTRLKIARAKKSMLIAIKTFDYGARRDRLGSCFFGPPPARKQRLLLPCGKLKDWLRPSCRLGLAWGADVCPRATSPPDGDKAPKKQTGGLRRHG